MTAASNIILITNDRAVTAALKPKLVLLREIDNVSSVPYADAIKTIKKMLPEVILLHCGEEKDSCLGLLKLIREDEETKNISILLIIDNYDQDFVLQAYDENITDYLTLGADDAEILMRTIWGIKKTRIMTTIKKQGDLLEDLGFIDKSTGLYTGKHSENILDKELKTLQKSKSNSMLMLISASEESKTKLNPIQLAQSIKNSIRESDIIVHGDANRFYVLLAETPLKGAFCVWDKIKQTVGKDYTLNASISEIGKKGFDELKTELLNSLVESASTKQDLVIVSEEEEKDNSEDWLKKINSTQKNFKLFKQAFNKKLEKVITPVFFQIQKLYEEKLFQTQVEQYSNSTLSAFTLKKDDKVSEFKITYPGFSKINIDIIHQGLDSPENRRISLDLTELDEHRLTKILEDFIKEFKVSEQ